jgi:hypothetical protein
MVRVDLRDIVGPEDRALIMALRRGPGQDKYLNSMEDIFAEADKDASHASPLDGAGRRDRCAGRLCDDQR